MNNFMHRANELAEIGFNNNEIPIGAVVVLNNQIIGEGYNTREKENDISGHAEIMAIKKASHHINSWKLDECEIYITSEPCLMCYGAIYQSRIKKIYIGSKMDQIKKYSYKNSHQNLQLEINEDYLNDGSKQLMKDFFKNMRGV